MKYRFPVTVITPSIDSPKLQDAKRSVAEQTYSNLKHLVVFDGVKNRTLYREHYPNLDYVELPESTGKNGFYGHRIYAAFSHLINSDYICFLDEDNWFEPNHVETLVDTLEANPNAGFAYSLRNIWSPDKQFICKDNCESLGNWPIWCSPPDNLQYLIDTSSFCFKRSTLVNFGHLWHSGWGGDRRFLSLISPHVPYICSGKYTLNYRLDGNPNSVNGDFFEQGNKAVSDNLKAMGLKLWPWSQEEIT